MGRHGNGRGEVVGRGGWDPYDEEIQPLADLSEGSQVLSAHSGSGSKYIHDIMKI